MLPSPIIYDSTYFKRNYILSVPGLLLGGRRVEPPEAEIDGSKYGHQ
jgi:hypothetical protein